MDFRMTEEQELLLDGLRELMERECSEDYIKQCDAEGRPPVEFYKALVDNGYGLLGCPESVGGTPVDNLTLMLVKEEICRLGGPIHALTSMFHVDMMKEFGTEEQLEKCMAEINEGRMPFCSGFSEPQAGSDSHAILTSYVRREDGKIEINGHKTFISMAGLCPYMACLARDFTREGEYFTMFFVPMDAPGVKTAPLHKIGWNMNPTYEVYLENVVVEEKDIIGKEGEAFKQLMRNFEMERLMMAVAILGMAECAYEDAAKYANQRVQFGKPIGTRQLIQEKIVNMKIKIMNMKNLCYQCAWEKDQGISIRNASALCKLYCAQAGNEVIDDALQIMGGIGYTQDCRISRLWRDARNYRIGGGTDEIMIHIAGRGMLKEIG